MTTELLLAIAALCAEPNQDRTQCKTAMIDCVNDSAIKDADALAKCYLDEYMIGKPWLPKIKTEQRAGRCGGTIEDEGDCR